MNLCIHGHFYQPPREDPISDYIPEELGAEPYRNWNERILAECYRPNAEEGNFGKISFNIGPTLFRWMQMAAPDVCEMIIKQERDNFNTYGTGNGMAQAYNHSILPLATLEDKITQVRWGISDFKFRFGHAPEGMWLPETAANMETLCFLSDCGIRFTILAPWQIVPHCKNKTGAYAVELPGGREPFIIFSYDQEFSTIVSFVPEMTVNGDYFLEVLKEKRGNLPDHLVTVASDGELYGHHQKQRDLFLRYLLNEGGQAHGVDWIYPGLWLKEHQVVDIADLVENTSWSCLHGIERWRAACGCTPWADWKLPLRNALNAIGDWVNQIYYSQMINRFPDPWELRNRYIEVLTKQISLAELCKKLTNQTWKDDDLDFVQTMLEAQYERQRSFTSCGFFFDEFHRIEPQNNIAYAAKAVWLTEQATGQQMDSGVLEDLKMARSQRTGLRGDTIYDQTILRAKAESKVN
jgi:alpha-amylase/alpha-mannosidase (GH57 family)